jgi:glucose dehydrogenase
LNLAWSFSICVLRGHKGNVLVIDETMYVHTPFPNMVFAHDLNNNGAIKWKYQPTQSYHETVEQFISILSGVSGWAGIGMVMIKTPMALVLLVLTEHYLVGLIWVGF